MLFLNKYKLQWNALIGSLQSLIFNSLLMVFAFHFLDTKYAILISLAVYGMWAAQYSMKYQIEEMFHKLSMEAWHTALTTRIGLSSGNDRIEDHDWQEISKSALADIRSSLEDARLKSKLGGSAGYLIVPVVSLAISASMMGICYLIAHAF